MTKTLRHRLLEVLRDNPGVSLKELTEILGLDMNITRSIVYRLKTRGYVEKVGKGYVLTESGQRYVEYLTYRGRNLPKPTTSREDREIKHIETRKETTSRLVETTTETESRDKLVDLVETVKNIQDRLRDIEKKIQLIESQIKNIEKAITTPHRKHESPVLETPVMYYNDALSKYGAQVEKMILDKKILRVGSLIIDIEFYRQFKSKFPIRITEVDKLSHEEKILLEEMRKEALVVLHAGREYKLVE